MQQATRPWLDQLAGQPAISIEQIAQLLGLGRTAAYDAARRGRRKPQLRSPGWSTGFRATE